MNKIRKRVGIAGLGAIGGTVAKALQAGIAGLQLHAVSEINPNTDIFDGPYVDFETLAKECDLIIECLPPAIVPKLAKHVFENDKDLVLITSSALLTTPGLIDASKRKRGRIFVPSGALIALDGVNALAQIGITSSKIITTKPPKNYDGAPYIKDRKLDLHTIQSKTKIFEGNANEASKAFPANVNVAATLSLAGIGADATRVEIWADPNVTTNSHEIFVQSEFSNIQAKVENKPDPQNPKSSMLTAQSIIYVLRGLHDPFIIL